MPAYSCGHNMPLSKSQAAMDMLRTKSCPECRRREKKEREHLNNHLLVKPEDQIHSELEEMKVENKALAEKLLEAQKALALQRELALTEKKAAKRTGRKSGSGNPKVSKQGKIRV